MRFTIVLGLTILLASCATTMNNYYPQTVQSWRGGSVNQLVKLWGRPDRMATTPSGNRLFVYQTQSYRSNVSQPYAAVGMHVSSDGRPVMTAGNGSNPTWNASPTAVSCAASFEANSKGQIVNTQVIGTGCYASAGFAKRMTNPGAN